MYNKVLTAVAAKIKAELSAHAVYIDEIPRESDGKIFVRIIEDVREDFCHRTRYHFDFEALYFQAEHDTFTYGEWVDAMFPALKSIEVDGLVLPFKEKSARQDADNRFYQFLFALDFTVVQIPTGNPMQTLKTTILE